MKHKLFRISTIAMSLDFLVKGQLSFMQNYYEVSAISGNDKHLVEVGKREGVNIINISMKRNISLINDLISLLRLYKCFIQEKPLIVHSITPKAGLLSMAAAYFAGVPIRIHTFTGLIFPSKSGILKHMLILMDRILCCMATNVYPEGQGVKNDLITFKITNKPLKVLANGNVNGIDINYFSGSHFPDASKAKLRELLKINHLDFVFIFVGRLVGDKGINELVEAFSMLSKEKSNAKLLLVGDFEGALDPLFSQTIAEIANNKNIISVGFQKDVRPYFAISQVLAFPSYREGFPNVVMQAGAMGLPSIVSDINGCNEIIVDGENGMIIPVKNVKALFDAMDRVMANDNLRTNLLKNAREMIVSRYDQQIVWNAILAEYKKIEDYV